MKKLSGAALIVLAACTTSDADARWRYEKILWEHQQRVASPGEAQGVFDALTAASELTLDDCYRMSIHRSEALAISGEELVRLQAQYEQAVASVLPRVSFKGTYQRQDTPPATAGSTGVRQSLTLSERTELKLSARQPIFSGLKEFYALAQASALYEAKEHQLRHARLLLYADVADAFFSVLQLEREIATTRETLTLARERLEELEQRRKAQISRRSEVLAQEAEVASTEAQVRRLEGSRAVAWEALKFATGLREPRTLRDETPEPAEPPPIESFIDRAADARQDLRSLEKQVEAAEQAVGVARAGYLPSVTIEPNYYLERQGISEGIDWDVLVSFEVPIFEGGHTAAALDEAESQIRTARFQLVRARRDLEVQIQRAHAEARALHGELESLEKAVASAQENYDIVQAEYRQGIVTNIEVLNSFDTLQRATLDRDRARFQAKLANVRLAVQSGVPPGETK